MRSSSALNSCPFDNFKFRSSCVCFSSRRSSESFHTTDISSAKHFKNSFTFDLSVSDECVNFTFEPVVVTPVCSAAYAQPLQMSHR